MCWDRIIEAESNPDLDAVLQDAAKAAQAPEPAEAVLT